MGAAAEPVGVDANQAPDAQPSRWRRTGDIHRVGNTPAPNRAKVVAHRVQAHAATLGIRDFQHIGARPPLE